MRRARAAGLPGKAFEARSIAPQIKRVREDYASAARVRRHQTPSHRVLLIATRREVSRLEFFRHRSPGDELHGREAA